MRSRSSQSQPENLIDNVPVPCHGCFCLLYCSRHLQRASAKPTLLSSPGAEGVCAKLTPTRRSGRARGARGTGDPTQTEGQALSTQLPNIGTKPKRPRCKHGTNQVQNASHFPRVLGFYQNKSRFPSILQATFSALHFNTSLTQPLSQRLIPFDRFTGTRKFWKYRKMILVLRVS